MGFSRQKLNTFLSDVQLTGAQQLAAPDWLACPALPLPCHAMPCGCDGLRWRHGIEAVVPAFAGTLAWAAPELLMGSQKISAAVDVYS